MENNNENKVTTFINRIFSKKIYKVMLGAVAGAIIGVLYWEFIGCNGGSCPLTSNSTQTIIIFTIFGMWFSYRK